MDVRDAAETTRRPHRRSHPRHITTLKDKIEVRLVLNGATVHRAFFNDEEAAARFAFEKMHAYIAN
jgi:hypothetical protein